MAVNFHGNPLSCILFDIDGVLVRGFHHREEYRTLWNQNLKRDLGIEPIKLDELFFKERFSEVLEGKRSLRPVLEEVLLELGSDVSVNALVSYWMKHDSNIDQDLLSYVKTLRKRCPRLTLAIASNQEATRVSYLWQRCGLKTYFNQIFYSAQIGYRKADPRFFRELLSRLDHPVEQYLLVDDDPVVIGVANNMGMKTFLYKEPNESLGYLKKSLSFNEKL